MKKIIIVVVILVVVIGAAVGVYFYQKKKKEEAKPNPEEKPDAKAFPQVTKGPKISDSFKEFLTTAKGATEGDSGTGRKKPVMGLPNNNF